MQIVVVGSLVTDLVTRLPRLPRVGETLKAEHAERHPGGKGLNQAVAAARYGAQVAMVGRVGDDAFGIELLRVLDKEGIGRQHVTPLEGATTGYAVPMVLPGGNNAIILCPEANDLVSVRSVNIAETLITSAKALILQNEIPIESSIAAAELARNAGVLVVANPAPASRDVAQLARVSDWFIPNEVEASQLTGIKVVDVATAKSASRALLSGGVTRGVIVTMGKDGVVWATPRASGHVRSLTVDAVDPTGAGDAFVGVFTASYVMGAPLQDAILDGVAAGALSTTRYGAQAALPCSEEIADAVSRLRQSQGD